MKDPLEYMTREYLPWMKGLISLDLTSKGYSQSRISSLLGVTQPSINYYLKRDKTEYVKRLAALGLTEDAIGDQEERIVNALQMRSSEGSKRLLLTYMDILSSGMLCDHHKKVGRLPADCDACMKLFGSGSTSTRASVLLELNEAISMLEDSPQFARLIPEVHTNFVAATKDARTERDVAGVAGRIVKLRGRAKAMNGPEFGASRHLASVLLAAKSGFPEVGSVMNVKYDERVDAAMKGLGWRIGRAALQSEPDRVKDPVLASIVEALGSADEPDAVVHAGGYGLEPATYVFGRDPQDAARKALHLADRCAKSG